MHYLEGLEENIIKCVTKFGNILVCGWWWVTSGKQKKKEKKIHFTLRFSKFRILCSNIMMTCRIGEEFSSTTSAAFLALEDCCFSNFILEAEGILYRQQLKQEYFLKYFFGSI